MMKGHMWGKDLIRMIYRIELNLTGFFYISTSVLY